MIKLEIWKLLSMLWCLRCCFSQHKSTEFATAALSCSPSCEVYLSNGDLNIDDESLEPNKIPWKLFDTVNYIHQRGDGPGERSRNTLSQNLYFTVMLRDIQASGARVSWSACQGTHAQRLAGFIITVEVLLADAAGEEGHSTEPLPKVSNDE